MDGTTEGLLGDLAHSLSLCVKEHEPSKTLFEYIRSKMVAILQTISDKCKGEAELLQTGSSYDDLHMCRTMIGLDKQQVFFPPTDFDFMMIFKKYKIQDMSKLALEDMDSGVLKSILQTSNDFAIMSKSENPGYVRLTITDTGRIMIDRPECRIGALIDAHGHIPNNIFRAGVLSEDVGLIGGGGTKKTNSAEGPPASSCSVAEGTSSRGDGVALAEGAAQKKDSAFGDTAGKNINITPPQKVTGKDIRSEATETRYIVSGPALTSMEYEKQGFSYDFVHAFPCLTWPEMAGRWDKRPRDANWPSKEIIQEVMQDGCSVVPVGYYTSKERDMEWRLSFNKSERKLSLCLSANQRTCYCLVKLMIKAQLSPSASLTSYMVKNMMFWFCEQQYGEDEWGNDVLGQRIVQFIGYICTALEHHNIPHYFLPTNNLIRHKPVDEVQVTLAEMRVMKNKPFETIASICNRIHCFDILKGGDKLMRSGDERQNMLILYSTFVQTLYRLGLMNVSSKDLARRCFELVVRLNCHAGCYIKQASHAFSSLSVPELLKPVATATMQAGEVDNALVLFDIMLQSDKEKVITSYPETLTNIACLYTCKKDLTADKQLKEEYDKKATDFYTLAFEQIKDSASLHFAYGNYLYNSKRSIKKAKYHFTEAVQMGAPRKDDDALVQMEIPGCDTFKPSMSYVSGKLVAYYLLINCLTDTDDIYRARRIANTFEEYASSVSLKQRLVALKLCSLSYCKVGLQVKASLVAASIKSLDDKKL